ncbi:hypothetical protein A2870_00550 [Candidatus Curtissbacteria bacterium RIFCSPHIGHO2_01_FULL_41_11]|uniref:Uncharacterized protein n=1 Tax=Candidatus Curtissbacteria bacterium RIFCSPHIGHO2_01_FULL_41_11 TaxID=1797711 RepID=A0A1F5G8B7_9BACT|nr:MAG: hypothetical protein A2870_00550 [Candidatus Curtissbacteria bacterium RIFCSPHIGHO2_01_FULL_41_11]
MNKILGNFDKYDLEAKFFPLILAFLPLVIFFYSVQGFFNGPNLLLRIVSSSILFGALAYSLMDLIRNLGKELENRIFDHEMSFPTTELLLHSNDFFSREKKKLIYDKVKKDFGTLLFNPTQEHADEKIARKKIVETVGQMRQKVDKGRLLIKYNMRYGFWRNLIAASPIAAALAFISSVVLIVFLNNLVSGVLILLLFVGYLCLWIFRKQIIIPFANQYANQFFLEYLRS